MREVTRLIMSASCKCTNLLTNQKYVEFEWRKMIERCVTTNQNCTNCPVLWEANEMIINIKIFSFSYCNSSPFHLSFILIIFHMPTATLTALGKRNMLT